MCGWVCLGPLRSAAGCWGFHTQGCNDVLTGGPEASIGLFRMAFMIRTHHCKDERAHHKRRPDWPDQGLRRTHHKDHPSVRIIKIEVSGVRIIKPTQDQPAWPD